MAGSTEIKNFDKAVKTLSKNLTALENSVSNLILDTVALNKELKKGEVNQKNVSKSTKELNKTTEQLNAETKEFNKIQKQIATLSAQNSDLIKKEQASLEKLRQEKQKEKALSRDIVKFKNSEKGSIEQLAAANAILRKRLVAVNQTTEEGKKKADRLRSAIDKNDKKITGFSDNLTKQKRNIGNYGSALDNLPGPLGRATSGIKMLGGQLKALLLNPVVAFFVAIVAAITAMVKLLKRSEEGSNRLNAQFAKIRAILAVLLDRLSDFAEKAFDAFSNPKQAVIDLWETIKTNLVNRIKGLADLFIGLKDVTVNSFKLMSVSIKNLWSDQKESVAEAKEEISKAAKDIGTSFVQITTGMDEEQQKRFANGIKNVADEINREGEAAKNLELRRQALRKQEREFTVEREKLNLVVEQARELAQDEEKAIGLRQAAIERAITANKQLYDTEVNIAKERADIQQQEVDLGKSTADELDELENLKAEAFRKEAERARQNKALLRERTRLNNKANKEEKEEVEEKEVFLDEALLKEKQRLLAGEINREQFSNNILQIEIERLTKELDLANLTAEEKYRIQSELVDKQLELNEKILEDEERVNDEKIRLIEERLSLASEIGNQIFEIGNTFRDAELQSIENQKQYELNLAGDNEAKREKIEEKFAKKSAELNAKQAKSDKAQALFNAAINTAVGITKALPNLILATLIGVLGGVQIAAIASKPIPKFKHGTKGSLLSDTLAWVGDGDQSEVIKTKDNQFYVTPNKDTLVNLPRGSEVIPNIEQAISMYGGIHPKKIDELISKTGNTKVINHSTITTSRGIESTTKLANTKIKRIDTYFRK